MAVPQATHGEQFCCGREQAIAAHSGKFPTNGFTCVR